jgi:hypothetical protein
MFTIDPSIGSPAYLMAMTFTERRWKQEMYTQLPISQLPERTADRFTSHTVPGCGSAQHNDADLQ